MILQSAMIAVLLLGAAFCCYGSIDSGFDPKMLDGEWRRKPFSVITSAANPAWIMHAKSDRILFFSEIGAQELGTPARIFVTTQNGVKVVQRGDALKGDQMTAPWILASFAGSDGWDTFDVPWLIYLQKRPAEILLTDDDLEIRFEESDTGYVASMPLYGYLKVPQSGHEDKPFFGSKARTIKTWQWEESLPDEVIDRCNFWCRTFLRYPLGMWETFSVDRQNDLITVKQQYKWLSFDDDWGTEPLRFAPLPPTMGLVWLNPGFPVEFSHEIVDPELYTAYGPLVGALNTDAVEMRFKVLQYINETEKPKLPDSNDDVAARALSRLRETLEQRFPKSGEFDIDHGGGICGKVAKKTNYCWASMGDIWYSKSLPYLEAQRREVVASCLRKYYKDFVLTREPYDAHRGKLLFHGPGIGSWGSWGDSGKFSTNLLQGIWAYAHYTGDWDLIRDRWDLIKRLFILPEEIDWQGVGRGSIAEIGDMAPPCIAMARMAYQVGDMDYYNFAAYCFAKELVIHYVMSLGSKYFVENQPHNRMDEMDEKVFLTNYWGSTAGWQIDGPNYPVKTGERQYTNRWVRFHCQDTARFYRDVEPLRQAVETELNDERVGWGRFRDNEVKERSHLMRDDSHILPSFMRIRSLMLDEKPDALAKICDPDDVRSGSSSGIAAPMISYIRTSTPHEYQRIIPKSGEPSQFAPGTERAGGWKHGMVEPAESPPLVQALWEPWATPAWMFWGKDRKPLRFGAIKTSPELNEGFAEVVTLSLISSVKWFEPVKSRSIPEEQLEELRKRDEEVEWMVIGPFPNPEDDSLTEDEYPPEREIKPDAEYSIGDETLTWTKMKPENGALDLRKSFERDHGIAYLFNRVKCSEDQRAQILAGASGGCRIWVNDELVFSSHTRHSNYAPGKFKTVVDLKQGWNKLLVKVEGAWGHWKASCKLSHQDGLPLEDTEW